MKIYEIGTGYTPIPAQVAAATESVVEELTKALLALGQEVEILDISAARRAPHSLPIREVWVPPAITGADVRLGLLHKVKRVAYSVALAVKLRSILGRSEEQVLLHFHNQYNLFFFLRLTPQALRAKAVIAYTNHNGFWSLPWQEAEPVLRRRYFQEIEAMKKADLVFVLNEKMRENAAVHLGIPADRLVRVGNGVNTDIYRPLAADEAEKARKDLGLAGKKVILQVGSVNENKGQGRSLELLAPLMKEAPQLIFAYAGGIVSEEYQASVQTLTKNLGLEAQVRYLGSISPGEEMNRIYNLADATIFSSRYESFGLVCVESLAAGVPVLLAGDGLLDFGPGSVKTGEKSLKADLTRLKALREAARTNALNHYTWRTVALDHLAVMEKETLWQPKN